MRIVDLKRTQTNFVLSNDFFESVAIDIVEFDSKRSLYFTWCGYLQSKFLITSAIFAFVLFRRVSELFTFSRQSGGTFEIN